MTATERQQQREQIRERLGNEIGDERPVNLALAGLFIETLLNLGETMEDIRTETARIAEHIAHGNTFR